VAQEEAAAGKKISSLVIGLIVACLILAGGIGYFIYAKMTGEEVEEHTRREPGVLVKLGDPRDGLILNVGGTSSGRYLKIGVIVELRPDKKDNYGGDGKSVTVGQAKILDAVTHLLRSRKIEDFEPNKQDELKESIKKEITHQIGEDRVYDVYITNFILQ